MIDPTKREKLLQIITAQPEHSEGRALVTPAEFFDGNDDLGSIGCNLCDHPGMNTFIEVISEIRAIPDVSEIWIQIYDTDEGDWPFAENILIFGDISVDEVAALAARIEPSEVSELTVDWTPSRKPELMGMRHINLWWD